MRKSIGFFLVLIPLIFSIFLSSCNATQSVAITTEASIVSVNTEAEISVETSIKYPEPTGFVNDFAGVFTDDEKTQINDFVSNFEKETTAEIFVVTVNSLEGLSIEQYASELFNSLGIGKNDVDNGIKIR